MDLRVDWLLVSLWGSGQLCQCLIYLRGYCGRARHRGECFVAYLDQDDVCACLCQCDGDGLANASCAACDEGGLALEGEESVGRHGCGRDVEAIVRLGRLNE